MKLQKTGIILVSVPLAFGLVFILVLYLLLQRADRQADQQWRSRQAIELTGELGADTFEATQLVAAYATSSNPELSARYKQIVARLPAGYARLQELMSNDPAALDLLAQEAAHREKAFSILAKVQTTRPELMFCPHDWATTASHPRSAD